MHKSRQLIDGLTAGLFILLLTNISWAKSPINTDSRGLAVKGYDVVAYFTQEKPIKGDSQITYEWRGAKWRFANAQHLEAFKADPEKYAPQYGGY